MIVLSYNCRGLASPHKKSSVKRMISFVGPQIILLEETMGPRDLVREVLESWLLGWSFEVVGRLGGVAISWVPALTRCEFLWGFRGGLGLKVFCQDLDRTFMMVNIYGPYQERLAFWDGIFSMS